MPELVIACSQSQQKGRFVGHLLHKPAVLRLGLRKAAGIEELIRGSEVCRLQQRQKDQAFQHKLGSITEPSGGARKSRIDITFSRAEFSRRMVMEALGKEYIVSFPPVTVDFICGPSGSAWPSALFGRH